MKLDKGWHYVMDTKTFENEDGRHVSYYEEYTTSASIQDSSIIYHQRIYYLASEEGLNTKRGRWLVVKILDQLAPPLSHTKD